MRSYCNSYFSIGIREYEGAQETASSQRQMSHSNAGQMIEAEFVSSVKPCILFMTTVYVALQVAGPWNMALLDSNLHVAPKYQITNRVLKGPLDVLLIRASQLFLLTIILQSILPHTTNHLSSVPLLKKSIVA